MQKPIEVQVGGRSVVAKEIEQHVAVLEEDNKFLKLLEVSQLCHIFNAELSTQCSNFLFRF